MFFFFQFWHHFAEKWRHKFGTEFRNLVLRVGGRKRENAGSEDANFALLRNILRRRYLKQLFTSDFYTL